jgi:hypothetical protein
MDSAKVKKLQDYASFLVKQAETKEHQGNYADASRDYVKLVDILLLLANDAKDHPTWQQIISKVEYYQKKIKTLSGGESMPVRSEGPRTGDNQSNSHTAASKPSDQNAGSSSLLKSFKKIGLIGKNQQQEIEQKSPPLPVEQKITDTWIADIAKQKPPAISQPEPKSYAELAGENEKLKAKIQSLESVEKEYAGAFDEVRRQSDEKFASMKSEIEDLQAKIRTSIPRSEYEKLRDTLDKMVSKDKLKEAERYISELEARLDDSVPRTVLNQIADYTSLLISSSSIELLDDGIQDHRTEKPGPQKRKIDPPEISTARDLLSEKLLFKLNEKPLRRNLPFEPPEKPRVYQLNPEIEVQSDLSESQANAGEKAD